MTVPFARAFPAFALRPRRAFWFFIVAVPSLAVAALNTGNNALYMLLSLAMGAFVASGSLSRHTLSRIRLRVTPPRELFAGSPSFVEVEVENTSHWLPAAGVVCRVAGTSSRVCIPAVAPRGRARAQLPVVLPRRGLHRLPQVRIEVVLPLGFFVKSVGGAGGTDVLVYPRRFAGGAPRWAAVSAGDREGSTGPYRRGGEVHQLREFRPGDAVRDIHWKQTARQQRPVVVERREPARESSFLVLDRELPSLEDERILAGFEDLVSEVASAALVRLRAGGAVGLVIGGRRIAPAAGGDQARRLLRELALVPPVLAGQDPLSLPPGVLGIYRLAGGRR